MCIFQDIRVLSSLRTKYGDDLLEQTLTVCSGLDMVNIYNCYFVFPNKKVMEVGGSQTLVKGSFNNQKPRNTINNQNFLFLL